MPKCNIEGCISTVNDDQHTCGRCLEELQSLRSHIVRSTGKTCLNFPGYLKKILEPFMPSVRKMNLHDFSVAIRPEDQDCADGIFAEFERQGRELSEIGKYLKDESK